ncbi:hypothetical protein TRFO_14968 [Tritrichomonas foetus]|uniref:Uncharacterized protein n=1 Tax=Tritrichomonas foetus TaxID=1144522 RepID=A0A1J4KTV4_9EUKA|nr:hypothetical protein TRFO_14968 [Tritrichomonas foetus]|eukprot:OHT14570.1 hypothetical protein TRFO_14968 [Tritrichomonas foetus]
MNIFPSQEDSTRKFSLWCNEKLHEFPADTFTRVSKKCAALVKANDYQGTITHQVSDETFEAFSAACKLEPFKVTLNNAFELLELAQEWGIPSLETFVTNYIVSKGLKRRDIGDPLGSLIIHLEEEAEEPALVRDVKHIELIRQDIEGVAHMFNQYLTDERLSQVHPEVLFKIMMQAEEHHINQQLLIDFVMKLLETEPEKAVPLCLRIDFDLLTDSQVEEIFQCREIYEESMGYFIAFSMSAIRNKQQHNLAETEQRYLKEMQEIREIIIKDRAGALSKVTEEFEAKMKELNELADNQEDQIKELKQLRDEQQKLLDEEDERFDKEAHRFEKEMIRQKDYLDQMQMAVNERKHRVVEKVKEGCQPIIDDASNRIKETMEEDAKRREQVKSGLNQLMRRLQKAQDVEKARITEIDQEIDLIHNRIVDSFSAVAAKIVRDQYKYNSFLRDIDSRFEIFRAEPKIWDLDADKVEEQEKIIQEFESKLRKTCPINVNHQIKTSIEIFEKMANALSGNKFNNAA